MKPIDLLRFIILIIFILLTPAIFIAQDCDGYSVGSSSPCDIEPICNISVLDSACIKLEKRDVSYPFPGAAGCFVHDPTWFSFVAGTQSVTLEFDIHSCNLNLGIQLVIYEGSPNCEGDSIPTGLRIASGQPPNPGCIHYGPTENIPPFHTFTFDTEPGLFYYVLFDGWSGDLCTVDINILHGESVPDISGVPILDEINMMEFAGPDTICLGAQNFNLCAEELPIGATYCLFVLPDGDTIESDYLDKCLQLENEFTEPGVYEICVAASNNCQTTVFICTEVVVAQASHLIEVEEICEGLSYTWYGIELGTESLEPGEYEFSSVENTDPNGCIRSVTLELTIIDGEEFELDAGFTYTEENLIISFVDESAGPVDSYLWDFGDGNTSDLQNPRHQYEPGSYNVTLIINNGCYSDTITTMITTTTLQADLIVNGSVGCAPLNVSFGDATFGEVDLRKWEFEGGEPSSSSKKNQLVRYYTPGSFNVKLTVYREGDSSVIERENIIDVIDKPTAEFNIEVDDNVVVFENLSIGASEYKWDFGGYFESSEKNPEVTFPNQTKTYDIVLIAYNLCGSDTIRKTIEIEKTTSVTEYSEFFKIFPNPFQNEITIEHVERISIDEIELYSLEGNRLRVDYSIQSDNLYIINTAQLKPGMYVLKVRNGQDIYHDKLIKL